MPHPQDDLAPNAQVVVETSDEGWGETDLGMLLRGEPVAEDDTDNPGPAAVGVVVEGETPADAAAIVERIIAEFETE